MDQVWQAVILGLLQGLTEFLPISSSAHLILLPWMAGWESLGILFDVFLHAGTLLAVVIYFRAEVRELFFEFLDLLRLKKPKMGGEHSLMMTLIIGTIPAGLAALLLRGPIEEYLRIPAVTVLTLSGFGLLLWRMDRTGKQNRRFAQIGWKEGLLIGAAQAVALIPGVSRSGVTITMALYLGFSRRDSARFSFLLSFPILILATAEGILELIAGREDATVGGAALASGVIVSLLTGFFCIKFFLRYLEARSLTPFVVYRLLLATVILAGLLLA